MPQEVREWYDEIGTRWIGFTPNTHSVTPVHVANGMYRVVLGRSVDTKLLFRFVFSKTHKGEVWRGHEIASVYDHLVQEGGIDSDEVSQDAVAAFRPLLKSVVAADEAVYGDRMQSYTAGAAEFVTNDTIAQKGGEFIAVWLAQAVPSLRSTIEEALKSPDDTLSILCAPLTTSEVRESFDGPAAGALLTEPENLAAAALWRGLAAAGMTLDQHILAHPSKLTRLRSAVTFSSFALVRYLTALEAAHVPGVLVPPFLLDFTDDPGGPVRQASQLSYTRACNAMGRFYAWAFGKLLLEAHPLEDLRGMREVPPVTNSKERPDAIAAIWASATDEALSSDDPASVYGAALYDIAAYDKFANPVPYFRALGHTCGLLRPPANRQPNKHFAPQEELLDVLIRGVVSPGESVDLGALQDRLWERYSVVVGGRAADDAILRDAGIFQADSNALRINRERFATRLRALDFATPLADGVLHVHVARR
jgi:hypothetical protein